MQQHFAYRVNISNLLPLARMNRTELRAKTRRENFARLRARYKTNAAFADALGDGFSPSYVSQLMSGHRSIGDDVADKIEEALKCEPGFLDQAVADSEPAPLSTDDKQTLELSAYLPPDKLAALIDRIRSERDAKGALLAALLACQREDEGRTPEPSPQKPELPSRPHGKPYKLPEPGVARPHAGHHKKRSA